MHLNLRRPAWVFTVWTYTPSTTQPITLILMLCIVFWSILPLGDGACADKAAAKPATRPKEATRLLRCIPSIC